MAPTNKKTTANKKKTANKKTAGGKAKAAKKGTRLPFPLENEASLADLVKRATEVSAATWDMRYLAEIGIFELARGEHDAAEKIIGSIELADVDQFAPFAHAVAYQAQAGPKEAAARHVERAIEEFPEEEKEDFAGPVGSWLGAAKVLLDGDDDGWLTAAREHVDREGEVARHLATSLAFLGRWDALDELIDAHPIAGDAWELAELCHLCRSDPTRFARLARRFENWSPGLAEVVARTLLEAGAAKAAWDLRGAIDGVSLWTYENDVLSAIATEEGVAGVTQRLGPELAEAKAEGWPHREAEVLAMWSKYDPDHVRPLAAELRGRLELDNTHEVVVLAQTFARLGQPAELADLARKAGSGDHWIDILGMLEPGDALWAEAEKRAVEEASFYNYGKLLGALAKTPERFEQVVDELMDRVGKDIVELPPLVQTLAELGEYARANEFRMRATKGNRYIPSIALAEGAFRNGHLSAGLAMVGDMQDEMAKETVRALVYLHGDGVPRTSETLPYLWQT